MNRQTDPRPEGWDGYERRIDTEMLEEVGLPRAVRPLIFICGPTPLVEAVATALVKLRLKLGYDPTRVKTERFGPTGG
jgi:ferredoxin-NADP reductase